MRFTMTAAAIYQERGRPKEVNHVILEELTSKWARIAIVTVTPHF